MRAIKIISRLYVIKRSKRTSGRITLEKRSIDIQWSFLSLCITAFTFFVLRAIFGRLLGADGLGIYTLVYTIYLFGIQFAEFGIGTALTKYVAEHGDDIRKIRNLISVGLTASFITGLLMGSVLFLFSDLISITFFHNPEMAHLLKFTSLCFPFIAIQKTVLGALNGLLKMKYFAFLNIVQSFSIFVLSVFLVIYLKMGVVGTIFGFVIPTIIVGSLSLLFVKDHLSANINYSTEILEKLLKFGFYVVLTNSTFIILYQIDSLMIGHFINETKVGYYVVAVIIIQGIMLLPNAVQRINFPTIANSYGRCEYENIEKLIKEMILKTFLITVSLSILLIICGKFLISFLFTADFLPAYIPLIILLIGYTIYSPFASLGGTLSSIGKVNIEFRINAVCALINTILNIILIPKFDIIGAAIATSISITFFAAIYGYSIKRYFRIHFS